MSNVEMVSSSMKGKGLNVLHTYMDHLWAFGDKSSPPALAAIDEKCVAEEMEGEGGEEEEKVEKTGTQMDLGHENGDPEQRGTVEEEGVSVCADLQELSLAEPLDEEGNGEQDGGTDEEEELDPRSPQEQMDELLLQCFYHALKTKVKKSELPLLTSTFLRNHMVSCCPSGKHLDIKKSSYKKLSKFLQSMQKDLKLVQVKELSKGVESIVDVDWKHPELRSFVAPEACGAEDSPAEGGGGGSEEPYQPPEITIMYSVSARLEPLFRDSHKRKGAVLQPAEVRSIVTDYVKQNELVDDHNKNFVTINPTLCDCLLEKSEYQEIEKLKWDDLFSRTLAKMQQCHQLQFPGRPAVVRKGAVELIDISVASRGSNKKVTMIKNLEAFGLDPSMVSATLQHRVQASSVLHPSPGTKDRVLVQIQGNQVQHVGKLLLDEYHIPRKYIQGLDKAPKPGKKK